jgi:serine/threonine protein phosphatase 1
MTYVCSDLHGRYDRYTEMLEIINFSPSDTLYVLGDSIDAPDGASGVDIAGLIKDMMRRDNIINLQGNHELWALPLLRPLKEIDFFEYGGILAYRRYPFKRACFRLDDWLSVGGMATLEGLANLSQKEAGEIIRYIESWKFYADITVAGKRYILSHAGLSDPDTPLEDLPYIGKDEWTFNSETDYNERYFPDIDDIYLVTGHVSTEYINSEYRGKI